MIATWYPFSQRSSSEQPKPFLPIRIYNPENGLATSMLGLVDTGAEWCVIPDYVATMLEHKLERGQRNEGVGAGGMTEGFLHRMKIEIFGLLPNGDCDLDNSIHAIEDTPICCIMNLTTVLLGVELFLEHFTLIVDYPNQRFRLMKHQVLLSLTFIMRPQDVLLSTFTYRLPHNSCWWGQVFPVLYRNSGLIRHATSQGLVIHERRYPSYSRFLGIRPE